MKTKKFVIAAWGEELLHYQKRIRIEVPDDVTTAEIESTPSKVLGDVREGTDWWVEESDGIWGSEKAVALVTKLDDSAPVQARLTRNSDGELVLAD